ncbi:chaperone modulator CbpM [Portibacter marinus]|uniref:chaperone modulator CbpM n=1 Tax=Portibacter marinus TaxID=2898660 RepID=UPI001F404A45|nr:chaperone modulator CbpM [Portibacter marinus]
METRTLIHIKEFCDSHGVEHTYIMRLKEFGLIDLEKEEYLELEMLPRVEKILRFNHDLDINLEGIQVILDLLERMERRDQQIRSLQNRLRIYE